MFFLIYLLVRFVFKFCFVFVGLGITFFLVIAAFPFSLFGNRRAAREIIRFSPLRAVRRLTY